MSDSTIAPRSRFRYRALRSARARRAPLIPPGQLDDYLLELILIDTLTVADASRESMSERLIRRIIPQSVYPRVLDRYDELSRDAVDDADVLAEWLPRAAMKGNRWKMKMIRWFVLIVGGGHWLTSEQLIEIAQLAAAMGAGPHCQRLFRAVFDFDPYNRPAPRRARPPRRNPLLFDDEAKG